MNYGATVTAVMYSAVINKPALLQVSQCIPGTCTSYISTAHTTQQQCLKCINTDLALGNN